MHPLIERELAKPFTHKVVTHYETGEAREHFTRGIAQAENYATGERRKIGRRLINRESGSAVCVTAVTVEAV